MTDAQEKLHNSLSKLIHKIKRKRKKPTPKTNLAKSQQQAALVAAMQKQQQSLNPYIQQQPQYMTYQPMVQNNTLQNNLIQPNNQMNVNNQVVPQTNQQTKKNAKSVSGKPQMKSDNKTIQPQTVQTAVQQPVAQYPPQQMTSWPPQQQQVMAYPQYVQYAPQMMNPVVQGFGENYSVSHYQIQTLGQQYQVDQAHRQQMRQEILNQTYLIDPAFSAAIGTDTPALAAASFVEPTPIASSNA
eukprot:UN29517